jgi:hypothetical protein
MTQAEVLAARPQAPSPAAPAAPRAPRGRWLARHPARPVTLLLAAGIATISAAAPGTLASPVSNRIISYTVRALGYLGDTAMPLFVGNLTERELPRGRLAWLLGLVGLYAVAGGVFGVFFAHLHFTSPLAAIVPHRLQAGNQFLQTQLHPAFAATGAPLGFLMFAYALLWRNAQAGA